MMDCKSVREQLSHFVCAELSAEETLQVVQHLAGCRRCAFEEAQFRRVTLLLGEWGEAELRPELVARIRAEASSRLPELAGMPDGEADAIPLRDRWNSLVETMRNAVSRCAPITYSMVAAAIVGVVLVLLKQPRRPVEPALLFLAGIWWASVANSIFRLALNSDERPPKRGGAKGRAQVDLRTTVMTGTVAATLVGGLFVFVSVLPIARYLQQIANQARIGDYLPAVCFSAASLTVVAFAVTAIAKLVKHEGRISGTLVGLIYSCMMVPLVYLANECRLDWVWLLCAAGTVACAIVGGLVGDFILISKRVPIVWR